MNNIPQYLIDCAKNRIEDIFRADDPEIYKKKLDGCRSEIQEKIKDYRHWQKRIHDSLYTRGELIAWLKSIGEYETGEPEPAGQL